MVRASVHASVPKQCFGSRQPKQCFGPCFGLCFVLGLGFTLGLSVVTEAVLR